MYWLVPSDQVIGGALIGRPVWKFQSSSPVLAS